MKLVWRILILCATHAAVFVGAAMVYAGHGITEVFAAQMADPVVRVGLRLGGPDDGEDGRELDEDLIAVDKKLPRPSGDVFRLISYLKGTRDNGNPDYPAAESTCRKLGWPKCDSDSLKGMREFLIQ
jgi:hypothetical protein